MVLHHGQSIAHSSTPRNPQIHVSSPFWAFFCARGAIIPPQPEKREREGSQATRRRNLARAPPPERGKAGATWLKLPTTARRVQRVSSLAGVACVEADPARRRPEHNVARSCGLDALAAPPSFPRASGVGRAAVASCWCVLRWRRGLRAFARRACRLRSGGNFARVFALCVPPCGFAVGVLLPGGPQPKARANPRLWPTAPALRLLRLADGLFCAGGRGCRRSAAASSASKRVSARPQRLFSACQGVSGASGPRSSPVVRAHPDPPNPCARASGLHVRLLGFLSLLGASPASVARLGFPRSARWWVVPRTNRLLSVSMRCCPSLRWPTPPPTRPPWRVHEGITWRAGRRRLLLSPLLSRPGLLGRWLLLFFGRRGSPAGRPRAFARRCLVLLPLLLNFPLGGSAVKGGTRPAAPPADAPDAADHIPRAGLRR